MPSRGPGAEEQGLDSSVGILRALGGMTGLYFAQMKTAISLPDDTFRRVDDAAKRMGVSRSEFFARAAERWLDALEDDGTTLAIDRAIAGVTADHAFTDAAAAALVTDNRPR
jgi:predicted DNA-binding protein